MKNNLLFVLILSGCTLSSELKKVEPPVPDKLPTTFSGGALSETKGEVELPGWRDFYKSQRLVSLIEKSLENNRDLKIAVLNAEMVRQSYGIQKSALFPDINLKATHRRQKLPPNLLRGGGGFQGAGLSADEGDGFIQEQNELSLGITAYELDLFGKLRSLSEAALQEYLASREAQRSARVALISQVASTYLRLLANKELELIARNTVKSQKETLEIISKRFKSGVDSELELRQAQVLLESAEADALAFKRETELAKNVLSFLVGGPVDLTNISSGLEDSMNSMKELHLGLSSSILLNRPDIKEAERNLKASHAVIGAARAAFFPSVALTTSIGKLSADTKDLFEEDSNTWLFSPSINVPIFTAGRNKARLRLVELRKEKSVGEYEKAIQDAFREAADALVSNTLLEKQLQTQSEVVKAARKASRLSRLRYQIGVDSYLNALDARRSLYTAQRGLVNQRLEYLTNLASLYKVLGGGVD